MNRVTRYRWLDTEQRIVHVTETIDGVGILIAHVNLSDDSVEIINAYPTESPGAFTHDDNGRILQGARDWKRRQTPPYPKDIKWREDGMKFETDRESREWATAVVYNEMGGLYNGYRTEDEQIACALVYELTRLNTLRGGTFRVFAHNEYDDTKQKYYYMVWVDHAL